jgi:hypothetical protein
MQPSVSSIALPVWMRTPLNPGTSTSRGSTQQNRLDIVNRIE